MPLLIISDQTALHTNLYVAFCFMTKEITFDYTWVLQQLHALYVALNLPNSTVIVTDIKRGLMAAIENIFSTFNHLLSL